MALSANLSPSSSSDANPPRCRFIRVCERLSRRATSPTLIHKVRLTTGLFLFTYVTTHLLNHSLGNISIEAMQTGLVIQRWIWQGVAGTAVLYVSLTAHFLLGLKAFADRRRHGWTAGGAVQLLLGFSIPFLLMNHIFVTRIALLQFDVTKGYPQELYSFWVAAPRLGVQQVIVLIVTWTHGCFGIYYWLRLKPFFPRVASVLTSAAVMLPVLALLGFYQGGSRVAALAHDQSWRIANLTLSQTGAPGQNAVLRAERDKAILVITVLISIVVLLHLLRTLRKAHRSSVRITYPDGRSIRVPLGFSVLQASRLAHIPHASLCGGRARCSTCRVRIVAGSGDIPPPSAGEQAILTWIGAEPLVRLACQLRPLGDIGVVPLLPSQFSLETLRRRSWPRSGSERFVVVLLADMRDSTRLAETRLPFDTVFIVNRFIDAISEAVTAVGGRPNQFTGDGLLAIFGLDCGPAEACHQAITAVALIGRKISDLNRVLVAEMGVPIHFGLGIHGSNAVVGEVDLADTRVFTALGDAANVAARIESLCKTYACEAVISESVCRRSGLPLGFLPSHDVMLRGREERLAIRVVARTEELAPLLHLG
jgi:adenylate cyclase